MSSGDGKQSILLLFQILFTNLKVGGFSLSSSSKQTKQMQFFQPLLIGHGY